MSDLHYQCKSRARRPRPKLLFFFLRLGFFGRCLAALLGFGFFHCFAGFFGFLGADLGALLALFVEHLLAAEQLNESLVSRITLSPVGADDARVSTVAVAEAR